MNTDAVAVSLNTLEKAGPEMTYIFMTNVVTMENIYVCLFVNVSFINLCGYLQYRTQTKIKKTIFKIFLLKLI